MALLFIKLVTKLFAYALILSFFQRLSVLLGHRMLWTEHPHRNVVRLTKKLVCLFGLFCIFVRYRRVEAEATHQMMVLSEDLAASITSAFVYLKLDAKLKPRYSPKRKA